ncbi:MAG: molybdopterin-guanine dinucleotide biosynthesis protein B [Mesorhizobium sp.]|nr:molybdopterin-guanine dinucleotide biosynthesis protein B [Mesorhizobium sp.]
MTRRVFGITGWKNSGKTTLTEKLVAEFTRRGVAVSTVKHAHHAFDIDKEGTDSFRHRAAGAREVAIVSQGRWALMHELRAEAEPSLDQILARLAPCDLVLIEGYKREAHAKIETRRQGTRDSAPLSATDPAIVAVASDHAQPGETLPVFDIDDALAIADFITLATGLTVNPVDRRG